MIESPPPTLSLKTGDKGGAPLIKLMYSLESKGWVTRPNFFNYKIWQRKQPRRPRREVQAGKQALIMKKSGSQRVESAARLIDARIQELGDWRGEMLSRLRALIKQADPKVVEEWKWRGTPVWSHDGLICTGEPYKSVVKMTFSRGASLDDPSGLFNSSLEGRTRRAIDFREGDKVNEKALRTLIRAAVALNTASASDG